MTPPPLPPRSHVQEPPETRLAILEMQMGRIVSDIESEKGTRARTNEQLFRENKEIRDTQEKHSRMLYMGLGGLMVLQFVIGLLVALKK